MSKVADIASAIIFLAIIAVIVKGKHSAQVLSSLGNAFDGSLAVAEAG